MSEEQSKCDQCGHILEILGKTVVCFRCDRDKFRGLYMLTRSRLEEVAHYVVMSGVTLEFPLPEAKTIAALAAEIAADVAALKAKLAAANKELDGVIVYHHAIQMYQTNLTNDDTIRLRKLYEHALDCQDHINKALTIIDGA